MGIPIALPLERLFAPGIRLGWTFRDRRAQATPYREPPPDLDVLQNQMTERAAVAQSRSAFARRWVIKPSLVAGFLFLLVAGYANDTHRHTQASLILAAAVVVAGSGLGYTVRSWWRRVRTSAARPERRYRKELQAWQQRAARWQQAELARTSQGPAWTPASPPARRTDIFGGSLAGWQALLTTHGTSILSVGPLLLMDLSGQQVSGELTAAAQAANVPTVQYDLPGALGRGGLLACLSPAQFADALTEAIHAGAPGGARTDRAVDVRVLEQLTAALSGWITPARLAAATQAALGHPVPPGLLSPQEEAMIAGGLFPASYQQQISPNLVRLDAFLVDLARCTGYAVAPPPPAPAYYTCLAMDAGARSARAEMLTALAIGWLTVQVSASNATAPAVIIAGADEITRPHLERLADACERRRVPLTLMFRHLREDALALLGGGTAAFMRLGNHAEAEQAASYIGRQHKFVLSQFTATAGGNQSFTRSDTDSYSDGTNSSRSHQEFHLGFGSRTRGTSTSRSWSTGSSQADGTSWSDATSTQRVYEYTVEPTVLQNLPDYALLLALPGSTGPQLRAVECNPAIADLPGDNPLPPVQRLMPPHRENTQLPPAAPAVPPAWPASPGWQPQATRSLPRPGPRRPPGRHRV
jgi:hypothetical protein